jgi:ankyrin repeat protein/N-acetylneuraminic acid mutarotase
MRRQITISVLVCVLILPILSYASKDIHRAVQEGNLSLVKEIIENQPESLFMKDSNGLTALHSASLLGQIEIMALLLDKGVDVNIISSNGETPLHSASSAGKKEAAAWLIEKGAEVDAGNRAGYTPLILAAMGGQADLMELLLQEGADPNRQNIHSQTPLVMAVSTGRIDLMKLLCANGAFIKKENLNLLHYAIMNQQQEAADFLIRQGLEIPVSGDTGRIFLHQAVQNGMTELSRLMIEKGIDIQALSPQGGTLLHSAAFGGDSSLISSLLGKGFDVNARDCYGMTALHFAAFHGLDDIIVRLVENGAEINPENILGMTPLDTALSYTREKSAEYLQSLGARKGRKKTARKLELKLAPSIVWQIGADLPSNIRNLGAADEDGKIYAVGGYDRYVMATRANYEYDPRKNTWAIRAGMPTPRSNLAVVSLNKKVYAVGGNAGDDRNEVYDPSSGEWHSLAPLPTPRIHLNGSAAVFSGRIYVMGGAEKWFVTSSKNEVYDPVSDSWDKKAPLPTPRQSAVLAVCGKKIYAMGGHGGYVPLFLKMPIVEAYDPRDDKWERKTDIPESGFVVGAVVVKEKIVVLLQTGLGDNEVSKIYAYDPEADKWSTPVDVPRAVRFSGMAYVDNALYIIGGGNSKNLFLSILIGKINKGADSHE